MDTAYFKELLLERKRQILKNLHATISEMESLKEVEVNDDGDYASLCTDNMIEHAIQSQQLKELEEIEYALKKIEKGEYGICEMCGEPIKPLRLKIKPYAKYCIVCREIIEKEPK
ncbi:MAG: RNA polymerase-binding protein DksA [Epsilonproteobacteria bacterium]|nr:RNA polymerase-binding protein DksA [Campylobacterota bacterium]